MDGEAPGRSLTQAADFGATQSPLAMHSRTLEPTSVYPELQEKMAVASIDRQGSDAPIGRDGEPPQEDDCKDHRISGSQSRKTWDMCQASH